ncbi:nucleic acid-binding protein [Methanobacterium subterraneum]|uniref:Nucleic acid-binding protein n=1 Tax=Methanobacterium subterraneum TaxID=59277 RepID=A0A2H4VET8_9EURY|nr:type II toxin-antitoxin system VapC family toxin [Methanobacterium subterraneum]AUB56560.1 nucleic acid-binding protein [Methanobacterium subterraneum]
MIFIDASFFIAASIKKDQWHTRVLEILPEVTKQDKITSIVVLSEAVTMVGSLAGGKMGGRLYNYIIDNHEVKFIDKDLSTQAMNFFLKYDGVLSFADSVSLELMKQGKVDTIASFDSDFDKVKGIMRIH